MVSLGTLLGVVYLLGLALWLGALVFWTLFVTPAAFKVLDRGSAGRLVSAVFPGYYLLGALATLVCFAVALLYARTGGVPARWALVGAFGLDFLLVLASVALQARLSVTSTRAPEFRQLHALSMAINLVMLLLTAVALVLTATEPGLLSSAV